MQSKLQTSKPDDSNTSYTNTTNQEFTYTKSNSTKNMIISYRAKKSSLSKLLDFDFSLYKKNRPFLVFHLFSTINNKPSPGTIFSLWRSNFYTKKINYKQRTKFQNFRPETSLILNILVWSFKPHVQIII